MGRVANVALLLKIRGSNYGVNGLTGPVRVAPAAVQRTTTETPVR